MNKRQKKKQIKMHNKKLIQRYPFLLPKNVWTGKVVWNYDYTWTDYDCLLDGWKKGFGKLLLEELREACIKTNFLNKLQFSQVKEKYGRLCMYNFGAPEEVHQVIQKYEFISQYVCAQCGSPQACVVDYYGWYWPLCEECWNKDVEYRKKHEYKVVIPWEELDKDTKIGLPNEYKVVRSNKGEETTVTYDISDTVNKIKKNYIKRINKMNRKKENVKDL